MQGRTRAKKSNKNLRAVQQVDFSLLTEEQKERSSARKELDVFIANPASEKKQARARIPSAFLTLDPDAFGHPQPLEKDMKDVIAERNATPADSAAAGQSARAVSADDAAPEQTAPASLTKPSAARPLTQEEELIVAAWMREQGMAAPASERRELPEQARSGAAGQQRDDSPGQTRTGAFMPQRSDAREPQRAGSSGAPARYPERRQRIPSEADAEWSSRRRMRGETPAQKAYRAAMQLPGASQPLTPPLNRPVPSAPKNRPAPAASQGRPDKMMQSTPGSRQTTAQPRLQTAVLPEQLASVQRETQSFKPVKPGATRVVTPEPVRETLPVNEPQEPEMTPLLPEDSPLSDTAPAADTNAPSGKTSDYLARSIATTPLAMQGTQHPVPEALREDRDMRRERKASKGKSRKKSASKQTKKGKRPAGDNTISTDLQTEIPVHAGKSTTRPQAYREEREKRRKKEERLTYIIVACVILFLVAGFFLFRIYMNYRRSADEYAELNETYVVMPAETVTEDAVQEEAAASPYPQLEINFASLHSLNEDFVGWIYVPGCGISYPIVRGQDNDYYLNHTFLKSESSSGAIFMDYQDAAGFIDFNTFIYGHNLKDGTMFTALADYRQNTELIRDYPYFYIYLNNRSVKKYRICAFYNDDGYSDSYFRVTTPEDRAAYVAMINSKSLMTQGFGLAEGEHAVTGDDLLVTLSTCEDSIRSGRRFLVHGYLVETFTPTGGTQP